jgi:hypothetical protein
MSEPKRADCVTETRSVSVGVLIMEMDDNNNKMPGCDDLYSGPCLRCPRNHLLMEIVLSRQTFATTENTNFQLVSSPPLYPCIAGCLNNIVLMNISTLRKREDTRFIRATCDL